MCLPFIARFKQACKIHQSQTQAIPGKYLVYLYYPNSWFLRDEAKDEKKKSQWLFSRFVNANSSALKSGRPLDRARPDLSLRPGDVIRSKSVRGCSSPAVRQSLAARMPPSFEASFTMGPVCRRFESFNGKPFSSAAEQQAVQRVWRAPNRTTEKSPAAAKADGACALRAVDAECASAFPPRSSSQRAATPRRFLASVSGSREPPCRIRAAGFFSAFLRLYGLHKEA